MPRTKLGERGRTISIRSTSEIVDGGNFMMINVKGVMQRCRELFPAVTERLRSIEEQVESLRKQETEGK
jgi:hypothetical protein